ncbi:MAG: MarR family transcriptional regulator [Chitinophagales bacterium]
MATIEEEIKQKRFNTEREKAAINLLFSSNWLYSHNAAFMKQFGVTPEQFNVLRILRGSHPKTLMLNDISSRMLDRNSNATRLVEKLRLKKLVEREICPSNRRQVDISITSSGLELLAKTDARMADLNRPLENLSEDEAKCLNLLLDKLRG